MFRLSLVFAALFAVALGSVLPPISSNAVQEEKGRAAGVIDASDGQFKYYASLRTIENLHFCSATIISNLWVLSAARCTIGRTTGNTRIVVGSHRRYVGGVTHATIAIVNHASYDPNTFANDVSMVRAVNAFTFNILVQPITLGSAFVGGGVNAMVNGFDQVIRYGPINVVKGINVGTLTNENCRLLHFSGYGHLVFDHKICTLTQAGRDLSMDSGGPLVVGNTVAGIRSWGVDCAEGRLDYFDRVVSHRNWILIFLNN